MPDYSYQKERELGCGMQFFRYLLMFINLIFALVALLGIAVSIVMIARRDSSYLSFCRICSNVNYLALVSCAVLCLFSILGFKALLNRNTCALITYGIYLFVFFAATLTIGIVIILVHQNKLDAELKKEWEHTVDDDPSAMCRFQDKASCSGWDELCNVTEIINGTITIKKTPQCALCIAAQAERVANMTTTCRDKLHDEVAKYFKPLVIITFTAVGLSLVSMLVVCNLKKEFEEYEEFIDNRV